VKTVLINEFTPELPTTTNIGFCCHRIAVALVVGMGEGERRKAPVMYRYGGRRGVALRCHGGVR
jgi:hypothetical protein